MGFLASYAKVAMPNPAPYLPPIMTDVVIDLYHGDNVNVDFSVIRSENIDAVILKASQGTWTDPAFLERVQEVRAAGLLVGAYHFLDGSSPADQIAHFLTVAKSEAGIEWLAIDWEPYPPSQATVMQAATAAASIYAATNKWPKLYTIRSMLSAPNQTLSNCDLWLAEYGTRPICPPGFSKWKLWQHTDGQVGSGVGPVPGIGPCDRSRFAGTVGELRAWWGSPTR